MKIFKQKHPRLPLLESYSESLPDSYWQHWHRRDYSSLTPATSWILPKALEDEARRLDYKDKDGRLRRTLDRLQGGVDIGCRGPGRLQTRAKNSPTAYEYGARVMDSIQGWVVDELCFGRLKPENSGVNKADFPTSMGSTKSFAISLYKAGCPAEMIKIDWNQGIVLVPIK